MISTISITSIIGGVGRMARIGSIRAMRTVEHCWTNNVRTSSTGSPTS